MKGDLDIDPRGLIYESYRMEGITPEQCRSVFLDWALGVPAGQDTDEQLRAFMIAYGNENPAHPMTAVLVEGLGKPAATGRRRGGRKAR